jgi:transposase InsO family protein
VREEEIDNVLQALYDDPATSKNGTNSLYDLVKSRFVGISQRACAEFLRNQEAHQLLLVPRKHKTVHSIVPAKVLQHMQVDLVDVSALAPQNKRWTFLLTAIDLFSKYAFVVPLKHKTEALVAAALKEVFDAGGRPRLLQSDNGSEFKNQSVHELCVQYGVKQLFSLPHTPQSQGAVERFNKTLKSAIHHYLVQHGTRAYHDVLKVIVGLYNTSVHSVTKERPVDVFSGHADMKAVRERVAARAVQTTGVPVFHKGDSVRLKLPKGPLEKKYTQNWTSEVFTVVKVNKHAPQNSYVVQDEDGYMLPKPYYAHSLQWVDLQKLVCACETATERAHQGAR